MPYCPIIGTLAYILSPDRSKVLLINRNKRPDDEHLGKYNGLGGKLERDEDVVSGMRREIREEAGIECEKIKLRGTINWPGFGKNGEDWLGFIFVVETFSGEPFTSNPEGSLSWEMLQKLDQLPMWEGDRYFLPLLFTDDERQFHGVMPYHEGRPTGWHYELI